jgi:hypothetical protein
MCCWWRVVVVVDRALVVVVVELAGYVLLLALASLATSLSRLVAVALVHQVGGWHQDLTAEQVLLALSLLLGAAAAGKLGLLPTQVQMVEQGVAAAAVAGKTL